METPQEPGTIDCATALASLARFVRRSLPADEGRAFRAHLTDCESCRQTYRQTLSTAARTARQRRARQEEEARIERRLDARRRVLAHGRLKPRRFGLRIAILPALVILALVGWPFARGGELVLAWERGEVRVGEEHLGERRPSEPLLGGEYVTVGAGARAALERDGERLDLVGPGLVLVGPRAGRELRLLDGQVAFEGAWTVATAAGVMTSEDGAGRLTLERGRVELACTAGEVRWHGPDGARVVRGGERWNSGAAPRPGP